MPRKSVDNNSSLMRNEMMNFSQLSTALAVFIFGNTLIVLIANLFFPRAVVLGTHTITPFIGGVYAMSVVALISVGMMPLIEWTLKQVNYALTNGQWIILYWVINTVAIWLVARFAEVVGMGISSWVVAVVMGLILDLAQGLLLAQVVSRREPHFV